MPGYLVASWGGEQREPVLVLVPVPVHDPPKAARS
jgi:hypothetical protein